MKARLPRAPWAPWAPPMAMEVFRNEDDIDGEMMKNMFDGYSVNVLTVFFVFFLMISIGGT